MGDSYDLLVEPKSMPLFSGLVPLGSLIVAALY